ncbi:MAG: hypothetical protein AAFU55_02810, partial [Pseudomonadota bacterium]
AMTAADRRDTDIMRTPQAVSAAFKQAAQRCKGDPSLPEAAADDRGAVNLLLKRHAGDLGSP